MAIVVPFLAAAFSSVIHNVDLGEFFDGGKTHAYIVLKLAALSITPLRMNVFRLSYTCFKCLSLGSEEGTAVASMKKCTRDEGETE